MRIGIVLPKLPGYSETFFKSKISGLIKNNHEVVLFINSSDYRVKRHLNCRVKYAVPLSGSTIHRFLKSSLALIWVFVWNSAECRLLYRLHKSNGDSIFHCCRSIILNSHILSENLDWLHFGYATMGVGREFVGRAIGAKTALSFRGFDIGIYPLRRPKIYYLLFNQIDKVHTISSDLLNKAYRFGLSPDTRVVKIAPAIDSSMFVSSKERSISNDSPIKILTVGRLHWKKGGELLLEALKILKSYEVDFNFTWIGDGPEYERLAFAAHQYNIAENVVFKGKLNHEDVAKIMSASDIYIQYSLQEGFCNAVLEAQSSGLLTIVSDAEGLGENVINGLTGWVVEKDNPQLLVETIIKVLNLSLEEHMTIRNSAIERIQSSFCVEHQQNLFLDFYENSISKDE